MTPPTLLSSVAISPVFPRSSLPILHTPCLLLDHQGPREERRERPDGGTALVDGGLNARLLLQNAGARIELLGDVCTSFSGQAEVAGVDLCSSPKVTGTVAIQGDVGRLDQVFGNLISNALRFTPPGGTIAVRAEVAGTAITFAG